MTREEIFRRCEENISLSSAATESLEDALANYGREIHRYELVKELAWRKKPVRNPVVSGLTNHRKRRCSNPPHPTLRQLR